MYNIKDISVVIPSYNNLEYLKLAYSSIREASNEIEIIMYSDGSTDGTQEWMLSLKDDNLKIEVIKERVGHTILYDKGFRESKRKIIGIIHADMVIDKDFFNNILKHFKPNTVVCGTCIEPPLHPPGGEKLIQNLGMYPEDFNKTSFYNFTSQMKIEYEDKISEGIFAPWFINKEEYFSKIGGHDTQYAPYGYEDSDLFTRMSLINFNFIQSRDAFVYHFTQRGHKWSQGIGIENKGYQEQMEKTRRIYVKKFGTDPIFDFNHKPTPSPKYNIGFNITNNNPELINLIEPYCSDLSIDGSKKLNNDIIVNFDINQINEINIQYIFQLPLIIKESGDIGEFILDIFKIEIKFLNEYQNELIFIQNNNI